MRCKERVVVNKEGLQLDEITKDMGKNKKYFVRTYGCQGNEADSEVMAGIFESLGFTYCEEAAKSDVVKVGVKVRVLDIEFDEEEVYTIVGSTEADPYKKKVSNESPIGKALLGAKKDQVIDVEAPAGIVQYKILSITK